MDCEQAKNLIGQRIAGEIASADQKALDTHLTACPGCRATMEAFRLQDAALRRAFTPHRASAECIADGVIEQVCVPHRRRLPIAVSTAASFLLGAFCFYQFQPASHAVSESVARLAVATGPVELHRPGAGVWTMLRVGDDVPAGSGVRTADNARCEFSLAGGSEMRLDEASELRFDGAHKIELIGGRMWSNVAASTVPVELQLPRAKISAQRASFDVNLSANGVEVLCVEGQLELTCNESTLKVPERHIVTIADATVGEPQSVDDFITPTRWVHDILIRKGRDHPEMVARIEGLLALLSQADEPQFYELAIRSCGEASFGPLNDYVQSPASRRQQGMRTRVARILSEVAQPWCIPQMIDLLDDETPDVRYHAAVALERLTGLNLCRTPEQWRDEAVSCAIGDQDWRVWWQKNKQRFPRP